MTYLCASVNSWSLGIKTNVRLLLPDLEPGQAPPPEGYAVLYLLHGYTGDGGDWMRLSRLERYLENKQAVAVMPDGGKGLYTDTCSGDAYWTYLSQELPQFIETNFAVSNRRERTFAAGLSMGGYGALKLALRRPERYAAAASFSGVVDVADTMELIREVPGLIPHCHVPPNFGAIFGSREQVCGTENDLTALLNAIPPQDCPALQLYCGAADALLASNERFAAAARLRGLPCRFERLPGGHEWGFWDEALGKTIKKWPLGG